MLTSPVAAVIGATDLDASAQFLSTFGFGVHARGALAAPAAAALYGLDRPTEEVELRAAGAASGHIRLVATPHAAPARHPYARGPAALDLYTDLDASLALAAARGIGHGPVGRVRVGPLEMGQVWLDGPDGLGLVLIEANHRRPSLLDMDSERLHSEAHSMIWSVDDIEVAGARFRDTGDLELPLVFDLRDREVSSFMRLPDEDVPMRMCMLSGQGTRPMRLELLQFGAHKGPDLGRDRLLRGGLHAPLFEVTDAAGPVAALAPPVTALVEVSSAVRGDGLAAAFVTAEGIRMEVWQRG